MTLNTGRLLDRPLALLDDEALELGHGGLDALEVRVDLERALEVVEGQLRLVEGEVDLPVAGEDAPVLRVALDHLVAVPERFLVLADEVIDRRALVPALGEVRLLLDDGGERLDGGRGGALAHLLHPEPEQRVDLRVTRAAPDLPERALGYRPHHLVLVAQGLEQGGGVGHSAQIAERGGRLTARLHIALRDLLERLLARHRGCRLGGRRPRGEDEREEERRAPHERPTSFRKAASSSVGTPRRRASSALEPG